MLMQQRLFSKIHPPQILTLILRNPQFQRHKLRLDRKRQRTSLLYTTVATLRRGGVQNKNQPGFPTSQVDFLGSPLHLQPGGTENPAGSGPSWTGTGQLRVQLLSSFHRTSEVQSKLNPND